MSGRRPFGWLLTAVWVLCAAPVFAAEGRTQEAPLVIGTELDYPPYSLLDENGKPTGYNVELTQAIAQVMELDIEVRIGPWAEIRQALETGEIDAISGMFHSVQRDRVVDFSPPYAVIHHAIFVRRDAPAIETEEDLRGRDIIVMRGDIMHDYVLAKGLCDSPVLVDTQADALRLLASGEHDCALVAKLPGLYWAKELGLSNMVTVGPLLRPSDYSYAVTEGDAALLGRLAEGLAIVEKTGRHKEVYDKWLGVLESRGASSGTVILYVALAAAIPLLLLTILAVWSRTLKRQVARRTEDLRESEKKFRAIFEQAAVGAAQIETPTGQFVRVNQRYCDIVGLTPDKITATTFMDITHPDDLQEYLDNMERLKAGEIHEFSMEKRYCRRDGSIVWVNLTVSPMWEPGEPQNYHVAVVEDITERKQAEAALRESEAKLRAIFNQTYQFIGLLSTEGRLLAANDTALAFGGLTESDVLGKFFWETPWWTHDAQQQAVLRSAIHRAAEGELVRFEAFHPDGEGGIRFADFSVKPVEDETGTIAFLLPEGRDLTERKRVEEALRESEERYRFFINNFQGIAFYGGWDFTPIFIRGTVEEITGYTEEDFITGEVRWDQLFHPDDLPDLHKFAEKIHKVPDHVVDYEHRIVRKDGQIRWVRELARSVCDDNGRPVFVHGAVYDITERRRAEEALRKAHERLTATFDALPDLLFEVDQEGRIYDYRAPNPSLLYAPPEAFLDKKMSEVLPVEAAQIIMQAIAEAAETGLHRGATYSLNLPAGLKWFELSIAGRGSKTPDARFVTLVRDITERKRAEEERISLERQVQHAQKLESLGVLAGGIAHDFNNLLMGILGNADLALNELSPMSPARGNLQEIEKASKRAAGLAKQMLAYSGKGRFVVEPINGNELVEEMAHLLEVSISKKVVLKYNFAENLPTFDGDVTQIRQVVMNLITNASEAIGEASGVIALSTGTLHCDRAYLDDVNEVLRAGLDEPLPDGVYTYLEVADTGCGMDAETVDKLFDPFFTTKFTGRGLGMSAVLGIVRGHAGAIKIYSEVGKGTTFKVLFPANERPDNAIAVRGKDQAPGKDWRGSGTVLLVDDEETVCTVGKQMLERLGFSVLSASDGREALKLFGERADEIVCVLLDLTMPHLDGEEAFREMRRLDPSVRGILCSGYNEPDATQRFAGKGLASFLQKPCNMATLREKLMDVLAAGEGEP